MGGSECRSASSCATTRKRSPAPRCAEARHQRFRSIAVDVRFSLGNRPKATPSPVPLCRPVTNTSCDRAFVSAVKSHSSRVDKLVRLRSSHAATYRSHPDCPQRGGCISRKSCMQTCSVRLVFARVGNGSKRQLADGLEPADSGRSGRSRNFYR